MEAMDARRNSQNDPMGECRSFGSNYFPSSQSRKMSIGIVVDSAARNQSGGTREDQVSAPNAGMKNSRKESSVGAKTQERGTVDANEGRQAEAPGHVSSPWITPRSVHQKTSNTKTMLPVKEPSNLASTKGRWGKLGGTKAENVEHAVLFFSNQPFSGNVKQKSDLFTGKSKESKGGSLWREEEFTFATAQGGIVSDEVVMEDKTEERRTETLRMKLCELLGTISSPKSQPSKCQAHDAGAKTLKAAQIFVQKDDVAFKPRQQSDTIETDSESPDCTVKRPVTRSLTRKKTSTKNPSKKTKGGPSYTCKEKFQKKNIHSDEGLSGKGQVTANGGSLMSMKRGQRKSSSIKPRKICFTNDNDVDIVPGETHRTETSSPTLKTSSAGNKTGSFPGFDPQNEKDCTNLIHKNQETDSDQPSGRNSLQSPRMPRIDQLGVHNSPAMPDNWDQQEDPVYDFQSPTLKMNTPISSSSPCSTLKTKQKNQNAPSPKKAERIFSASNVHSFRALQSSKVNSSASNVQTEPLDDGAEPKDSLPTKPPYLQEQLDVEVCLSESSSEDNYSVSSEEGSPINGVGLPTKLSYAKNAEVRLSNSTCEDQDSHSSRESSPVIDGFRETDTFSQEAAAAKGSKFMLYPNKRPCVQRGNKIDEFSPPLPSVKGTAESDWIPDLEPSGQTQGDDLQRVVVLFALALRNFKNKMTLATKRKSSEILMSVSEEIHQQLKNVESQILTDVGKLTNLSRSKRKRLEGRFQEQQEQLKFIHDKFKTDIHQHLEDCKNTLKGFEVHQTELKGAMKNQKASHQKLLLQAEEAIEIKLSDAERRITGVHKSAKEKMLQLRHAIAECLNEGGLS